MLIVVALVAASCGNTPQLTEEHMQRMSDADAMSLLQCQSEKVYDEMGGTKGNEYMTDIVEKSVKEGGPTLQIVLWREGYTCDEWGSNWKME
jgi:hypothetical protein